MIDLLWRNATDRAVGPDHGVTEADLAGLTGALLAAHKAVRAQGASPGQSFLFSFFASTFWEYIVEGVAEPASTQDLIVTPLAGSILGELSHRATLAMKKNGTSIVEGIIMTLINPTHVVMNGYH